MDMQAAHQTMNRSVTPEAAMRRALVLGRRGMGRVRPNPPVGAVVVQDQRIVGEGYHRVVGEAHAEIEAMRAAGDHTRGATLYVTLEPCNHDGKTPPCVSAIIEAGIKQVYIGARDPNPLSGDGIEALRNAGIEVVMGPERRRAGYLVAGFASRLERKRPRFALKMAVSLDGRIASGGGDSRWISSEVARAWVHRRRREADGIMVGVGTVLADNPALTTRAVKGRSPDRFVLDSKLRSSPKARVFREDGVRRVVVTTEDSTEKRASFEAQGVDIWAVAAEEGGRVSLPAFARKLGDEGYTQMLAEGGGTLAGALFSAHLVDVAWLVTAPHLLLGGTGPGWTQGLEVSAVPRALRISRADMRALGPDWITTLVPESAQWWDPETSHV
jgi:diaminohydroxyphosphoribosylaminopyrimidine deaminase/5-amino-6-(5-phosphoribosylamino)uracil reductase